MRERHREPRNGARELLQRRFFRVERASKPATPTFLSALRDAHPFWLRLRRFVGRPILAAAGFSRLYQPRRESSTRHLLNTAASPPNSPPDRIRTPTPRAPRLAPPRIPLLSYRPKQSACSVRIRRYTGLTCSRSGGLPTPTPPPPAPAMRPHPSQRTSFPHSWNSADGQTPCVPAAYPPNSAR